jgi:hypothetical protein
MQGRLIESHGTVNGATLDLDFSGRPEGMYLVRSNQNGSFFTLRIVVR